MLHVYCIRAAGDPHPPAGLAGVDEAPLRVVEERALAAWVSDGGGAAPTEARVRAHERVVRAALRTATPLPVRYADLAAGEDALRRVLRERAPEWRAALARVAGRVEMGIAVPADLSGAEPAPTPTDEGPPASGRAYLERRRAAAAAAERLLGAATARMDAAEAAMGEVPWPSARRVVARDGLAGTLAYLVPHGELPAFRERLETLRATLPAPAPSPTGPWAPYSFV